MKENDAAIDAWMLARKDDAQITNAELIALLRLLPPGDVPSMEDCRGIYHGTPLTRKMLSVGEKSFRLYIDGYLEPPNGREPE